MKKILNTNPDKRYKIDEIREHAWYKKSGVKKEQEGILVGYHDIPVILSSSVLNFFRLMKLFYKNQKIMILI